MDTALFLAFMLLSFACGVVFQHGLWLVQNEERSKHSRRRTRALDIDATSDGFPETRDSVEEWSTELALELAAAQLKVVSVSDATVSADPVNFMDSADLRWED